jgi:hypothetical protein
MPSLTPSILGLAVRIADEATRCDIESMCTGDGRWYDVRDVDPDWRPWVMQAVTYLESRELILVDGSRIRFVQAEGISP